MTKMSPGQYRQMISAWGQLAKIGVVFKNIQSKQYWDTCLLSVAEENNQNNARNWEKVAEDTRYLL